MKRLFNSKKTIIISSVVAVVVAAGILTVCLLPKNEEKKPEQPTTPQTSETSIVPPDIQADIPDETKAPETEDKIPDNGEGLKATEEKAVSTSGKTGGKITEGAKPITENPAPKPSTGNQGGGIVIGDGSPIEKYDCGVAGHHCDGPETHAYIQNLELEGCAYCGSHSCPSFYATDEWGNTCFTPSKCPKYDIKKDPVYYCQNCGKKCGDGKNGTCVTFNVDIYCPNCGKHVKAWICHYCE